jgi:hypothetical protein
VIWWCKARRIPLLAGCLAAYFALSLLARGTTVSLPSFLSPGGAAQMALAMFFAVVPAIALVACLESGVEAAEITGVRRIKSLDLSLSVATVVATALLSSVVAWLSGDAGAAVGGRNTAFLVGLALLVRAFAGRPAVVAPVFWPLLVAFFGFSSPDRPYHWTVLPEVLSAWYAAVGAALAFAVGLVAQFRTSRKTT